MPSLAFSISGILPYERSLDLYNSSFDYRIDYFEVRCEYKHADDHHHGSRLHAVAVGPCHALHLAPDVAQVTACVFDPVVLLRFQFASHILFHEDFQVTDFRAFGRGGGIRTPKNGFGDRRFTVEPTPLFRVSPDTSVH